MSENQDGIYQSPPPVTIAEERTRLKNNIHKGTKCKCCGQMVKLYTRKLYSSQMKGLINLYKKYMNKPDYYHISTFEIVAGGGDFAKMEFFGLIEAQTNTDSTKRTSGMWKPTQKGIDFVNGRISVPEAVMIYNQSFVGFTENHIYIKDAIGNKFNYEELMSDD